MMHRATLCLVAGALSVFAAGSADAQSRSCGRTSVRHGETAEAVARRCGVNVEALKALNPGLNGDRPPTGTFVIVPEPALPTTTPRIGGNSALKPVDPLTGARYRR